MTYAIVRCGGKQYRVTPGDVLQVERQPEREGTLALGEVLAVGDERGFNPHPPRGARVKATVVGTGRGPKIHVFHYKRKKQYKKLMGHRQAFTAVRIDAIEVES